MASTPLSPLYPGVEMFQKSSGHYSLFNGQTLAPRPVSQATEIHDTDFEDEEDEQDYSDVESNSPRTSIESAGKKSITTLSSYDEVSTPISNEFASFDFQLRNKPVEGPRGPHLFRASSDSYSESFHMSMSPITPSTPKAFPLRVETAFKVPPTPGFNNRPISTLTEAVARLDPAEVQSWSPRQVAKWMYEAGFEESIVEKFQQNDITGAILVALKFDDLKELDIQSFGKRHRLWTEIHNLRSSPDDSPAEDRLPGQHGSSRHRRHGECSSPNAEDGPPSARHRARKYRKPQTEDSVISPAESVSIVGIEQLLPKPHKCSKGERCAKYRKQQRQLAYLAQEHPVSPRYGGAIVISGNPGNAANAESLLRPMSDAVPSVVASSDVLGPGILPEFSSLQADSLRNIQHRDPQDNVKQFLDFQHVPSIPTEEPSTPPLELFPPLDSQDAVIRQSFRALPKLSIPPPRATTAFSPSQHMQAPNIYRNGTPASEMDVPVSAVELGAASRDLSQSVPPDMRYRRASTSLSRTRSRRDSRQPSFAMAKVDENPSLEAGSSSSSDGVEKPPVCVVRDVNHAGWMKKRKTKFLRHEWNEHHFRLKGTRLAMHPDDRTSRELEHIDVDDYAVACSSLGSSSKVSAALKNMKLSSSTGAKKEDDNCAFAFQLVPAAERKGLKHAALGKTHHFAVKSRDQRIDWMRELMLAKALRQKGEGYEINVNGSVI
ncbi:MAG: hypothetical protein M1825_000170 [Sarcosagium campestre]|nr:MAG: hypothetical protein M1825_000170 [Sarcosagium campestre]